MDFKYSTNGYWVAPDGAIHAMPEYQIHKVWMFERHGDEWVVERHHVELEAQRKGWVEITFGMMCTGFAIEFHENKVTKAAISSTREILKEHDPDEPVHINDCLGFKDGYFPWRKAYTTLAKYPEPIKPKPKLKKPVRGLSRTSFK